MPIASPAPSVNSRPASSGSGAIPPTPTRATSEAGPLTMQHDTLPPPSPETWQSTEPVDRWTANTRGFEHVPDTVPDFDQVMEQAMRDVG